MPKPDWFPVFTWELEELKGMLMGLVEDTLQNINTQLGKAKDEILSELGTLEQQIADNSVSPDTLQSLRDKAQALDDIVPDVTPPAEGGSDTTPPDNPAPGSAEAGATGTGAPESYTPPSEVDTGAGSNPSGFSEPVDVEPTDGT